MQRLSPLLLSIFLLACPGKDPDPEPWTPEPFPRCAAHSELRRPLFGDTHIHTALSLDADLQGTRLLPADAYRFARGETVGIQPHDADGNPLRSVRLERPLDWAVLSDHAEFLGLVTICTTPGEPGYDDPVCERYRTQPDTSFIGLNVLLTLTEDTVQQPLLCDVPGVDCSSAEQTAWAGVREAAEAAYDRSEACTFTSFTGYEWSSNPASYNLHRNVIFRNEQVPELPAGYLDEPHVEDLWASLRRDCLEGVEGCDVLTVPHNSNLSGGLMFDGLDRDEAPIDRTYAETRAAMEPLIEIFQHKGSSECRPGSTAGDELCGFEYLEFDSLSSANLDIPRQPEDSDFVRWALGRGMELRRDLGVNPYAYGIIASTDTHLGTPGLTSESAFPGHGGAGQPNREMPPGLVDRVYFNPGGLAVVWAEENSREGIFQAMRRKEAYGTSGPRITLRFFGGWDYEASICSDGNFARDGYDGGVPMGAELGPHGGGAAQPPVFAISALRDPGAGADPGIPLQRVQIVRGRLEGNGVRFEVFDALGDPDNGAGVDPDTCATTGAGFDELCGTWTDPDFDPAAPTFWYARVLENPTCRWSKRMCVAAGVDCADAGTVTEGFEGCCDDRVDDTVQERAWSSPIWWVP